MATDDRLAALVDLVELRVPVAAARAALARFPWDWDDDELVELAPAHLTSALTRYTAGSLGADDVVAWAESVHLRDDIGRRPGTDDLVNECLIEMSSPELFGELGEIAPALLQRLATAT